MARARRRDLKRELFWREMVHGQPGSGLSVRVWCRRHVLQESAFYWWRRRLAGRRGEKDGRPAEENSAAAFVPVRVDDDSVPMRVGDDGIAAAIDGAAAVTGVPDGNGAGAGVPDGNGAGRIEIVLAAGCRVQVLGRVDRQALTYTLNQWTALNVDTTDGDLAIDNNASENALRRVALGRKNWLFCGSNNGGQTAAVLFSLIATCQRHQVEPLSYFRRVLTQIAAHPVSRLAELLPATPAAT